MEINVLGIDLAKSVFQLHGVDRSGKTVFKKQLSRRELRPFVALLRPCLIGMEACGGAHHWAREFRKLGHEVKLMSPQFVKPYVKSNKTDAADAEAICEAVTRPNMRFVPIKELFQQDIQCLHRIRSRLVREKTALTNEIRGLLHEYGIVIPAGRSDWLKKLGILMHTYREEVSSLAQGLFSELSEELLAVEGRIQQCDAKVEALHKAHPISKRLATVPGVGPLTATALLAAISDPRLFRNGRELSAWLGLVPRQHSSGGKERLLGISKRGDSYLRTLLIHGARATLRWSKVKTDDRSRWATKLAERRGVNRAAVALANKNARVIWVILSRGEEYKERAQQASA